MAYIMQKSDHLIYARYVSISLCKRSTQSYQLLPVIPVSDTIKLDLLRLGGVGAGLLEPAAL
eukprot:scaffold473331_cov51-Prasinocladus_malaysianus.AAC.1